MILGIDASNILAGGGVAHLQNLLNAAQPQNFGIEKVSIWGGRIPLENLPQYNWLDLRKIPALNRALYYRLGWQQFHLAELAEGECDMLFIPGGLYLGNFRPYVTMFQNMQVFETSEFNREGVSKEMVRFFLLKAAQSFTFRRSQGLICLSEYSMNYLNLFYPNLLNGVPTRIIPHGSESVSRAVSSQSIKAEHPLRVLYVSTVKQYKHQWKLIDAIGRLRREGLNLKLDLIGGGDLRALRRMSKAINRNKDQGEFVNYRGNLSHVETLTRYQKSDLFVFPSSCETFGISLLEAMEAGLPIACSDRGPMPEILKDGGLYFNPESVSSIAECLRYLLEHPELRTRLGKKARKYARAYNWKKCADETFSFLKETHQNNLE